MQHPIQHQSGTARGTGGAMLFVTIQPQVTISSRRADSSQGIPRRRHQTSCSHPAFGTSARPMTITRNSACLHSDSGLAADAKSKRMACSGLSAVGRLQARQMPDHCATHENPGDTICETLLQLASEYETESADLSCSCAPP